MIRIRTVYIALFVFAFVAPQWLVSQSLNFDGVSGSVRIPHNQNLNIAESGTWSQGSIMAYIKLNDPTEDEYLRVVSKKVGWDDYYGYELEVNPALGFVTLLAGGEDYARGSFTATTSWTQIIASFNGSSAAIYVNGVDVTTDSTIGNIYGSTVPLYIGSLSNGPDENPSVFNGKIDDVAIWNQEQSSYSVSEIYNSGNALDVTTLSSSSYSLVGYWRMNEGSGSFVGDSRNDYNGSIYGNVTWSSDSPQQQLLPDYKWFSSDSAGGPVYSWQDITSTGTLISMSGDDNNTGPHPIGFVFPFYGIDYSTFRISTNGFISFTSSSNAYNNSEFPSAAAPEAALAPFWEDLIFTSDKAYYYGDENQLVITFNDVDRLGQEATSSYTFQVILKSTGEIIFQYNTMTGPLNGATIGWQNFYRTEGTSIVYNNANFNLIHDGWAVRIEDINSGLPPPSSFASAASYQTVDLSWVASSSDSVANYVIYRGTSSSSLSPLDSVASTVTSYSNTGLTNGTTYYYGIRSKSSSGDYSVMRTTSVTPNVASPTNLSATVTTGQATLSWTAAIGSSIAHTLIYQGTSSSNLSLVDSTSDASTATKTITGLINNTTYYFYVRSRGTDGSVSSATAQVEATPTYTGPVWWVSASVTSNGDGTQSSPFRYISSAITAAAEDDTVKLVAGTYTGANNRGLDTDKNLVFISASGAESTALDAGTYDRHFYFNDGQDSTFQIIGLTLKNGKKTNDNGGSVYIQNSSPIFKNCIFEENESGYSGGAIRIFEGSPEFRSCIFRNNSSGSQGGAIQITGTYNSGVAFRPVFKNCVFTSNSITVTGDFGNASGAAVYFDGTGSVEFSDCQFRYNSITSSGSGYGGAININGNYNNDGQVENPVLLNRCSFIGNSVSGQNNTYGAALKINSSTHIINCLIADNTMHGNQAGSGYWSPGAGIFIQLNSYWDSDEQAEENGTVKIINSTIVNNDNNSSGQQSGGLHISNSSDNLTMFNTILWGNTDEYNSGNPNINDQGTLLTDYNNIENGDTWSNLGSNSTYIDPQFSDATNGDYSLGIASSLVAAGVATFEGISAPTVDIRNNSTSYPRPNPSGSSPDLGAYESSYSSSPYPDAPTGLTATAGDGAITLSWTASSETDIAKYGVYYGTESGPTVKQAEVSGASTVTTTISGLSNNVAYYFRITAIDNDNYESGYSSEISASPAFSGSTIYVDNSGSEPSNPDGSESNAFYSIQDAIDAESTINGKRILVKAGTYTGSGSNPVIDLKGKNVIIESDAGPATTIIDAGGSRTALSLDKYDGQFSGYSASATKFIGLTFTNGDDDESLIDINGPNMNESTNSWDITFENCRFTNTNNDYGSRYSVVYVARSNSIFDGCQFRDLNIIGNFQNTSEKSAPIKIQGEDNWYYNPNTGQSEQDTTVYRPQFKNCVIADNSVVNTGSNKNYYDNYRGGGITVKVGAIPYFENTRIDSNTVDAGGDYPANFYAHINGGGVYIEGRYENDPPIKFVNCSISGNVAKGTNVNGGGVYTQAAQTQFINTVITNNLAYGAYDNDNHYVDVKGGGIYCSPNSNINNENPNYSSKEPLVLLVNCTVANNKLKYIAASSIDWAGAGIRRASYIDPVQIMNSIVYHNTVVGEESSSGAHKINMSQGNSGWGSQESTIGYSFIEHYDDAQIEGDEIYDYSPAFNDTANGDFSLSIASLAIGAGVSEYEDVDAPAYDYNNSARPNPAGSNPDLGAFENSLASSPYPAKPQSLTVSSTGDSTVVLSWAGSSESDLVRYRVYYGTSSPAATLIDSASASATSISVDGLTNETTYYFRITALDGDGYESIYSAEVSGTPEYRGPVWYVDVNDGGISAEGSTGDPFRDIQDAIDVSSAGDTVLVLPGTYAGNRSDNRELEFINDSDGSAKNIILKSRDGAATTFIDSRNYRSFEIENGNDTSLQIIGFTITSTTGGKDDGGGALVKIAGQYFYDQNTQQNSYVASSATFRNCIFTIFDSGSLQGDDLQDVAVNISVGGALFDNCEFTNITVDYDDYEYGDGNGGAISMNCGELYINRSKLTNITVSRSSGYSVLRGAAMFFDTCSETDVTIMNTIIADNLVSYTGGVGQYAEIRGGAINSIASGGNIQLINSTVVNNTLSSTASSQDGPIQGSAIFVGDWNMEGNSVSFTIFNSIVHGNRKVIYAGSSSEVRTNYGQVYIHDGNNEGVEGYASYSLIGGENNIEGDEILNLDPEFLDNTYALHPRSPAIGAGAVESEDAEGNIIYAPTVDIAGSSRPNPSDDDSYPGRDAVPDLGAMESELAVTPYPDSPTDLFVVENHQSVQLFWNPSNAGDVVKYKIYSSSDSITFTLSDSVSGRYNTEGSVGGLTNEEYYWFYVTSLDSNDYESSASLQVKAKPHYQGPVWYVDMNSGSGSHEGSATDAFRDIQDGIDAADEGDTVMVLPGTYERPDDQELEFIHDENSTILPKNIVLFARDGPDSTIIDGEGNKHLFVIEARNDTTLKIVGFTIQNGGGDFGGAAITVSGVYVGETNGTINFDPTGAVFENCIIKDADNNGIPAINVGYGGAAIFRDCLIKNNRNYTTGGQVDGAGIKVSQQGIVVLDRTKVMENYTDNNGAGSENHRGPGVHAENSTIYVINSLIAGNYSIEEHQGSANYGSGLYAWHSDVVIFNSTITDNQGIDNPGSGSGTAVEIGGDNVGQIVIFNSIITGNSPSNMQTYIQQNSGQYVAISNSIFEEGSSEWFFDDSEGCYDFDPLFEDSLGTLSAYSPAIGKGGTSIEDANGDDIPSPAVDLYGNPRPNPAGSNPDIGAYEHVRSDPRRLVYYVDDTIGNDTNDGITSETALKSIGEGLNKSSNRDTLELVAGTYNGADNRNLNMQGLTRIIRSVSGPTTTIIDCENQGPAFVFNNDESDSVHISGLTIINGSNNNGGAVSISGADPVFENMIFKDNNSSANGGAVYANNSQSSFTNSVFLDNHASSGAAVYSSGGDVSLNHCTLLENFGDDESGIKNASGDFILMNSIYWGNDSIAGDVDVLYSNIMGGHDGPGNFNGRPGFTDAENGDLSLLSWSPMIGRGNAANIIVSDILGTSRADSVAPDMGSYENSLDSPSAYSPVTWHVATTGTDTVVYNNITSISMPFNSLQWTMDHVLEGDSIIVHPGDHTGSADNWGKSVHIHGNAFAADEVSVLGELEFTGGSNSVNMLRVSNASGDGFTISAGSINMSYILVDNSSGKAIVISDTADAAITNITVYNNGDGLFHQTSGTVTLSNSILWSNTSGFGVSPLETGNLPIVSYSDFWGATSVYSGSGTGNIELDPLFVAAANNNFELDLLSPCIDAGDPSSLYDGDSTVADMGAFPRLRQFLADSSTGDVSVSADTTVIITENFTVSSSDTLELQAGAELYFAPGATLTIEGSLDAQGTPEDGVISFLPLHPDSTFGGVVISGGDGSGDGHRGRDSDTYSYIQISGVEADSVPLTINGSATLDHVTIAGNGNSVSLSTTGTVDLNYSILEGQTDGTVNILGSFTSSTDQFLDYPNDDFTLLATAAGIDIDTEKTDPDYTYGDAGAFYHDQSSYPVTSITVLRPASGDTVLASPDTSTTVGLRSKIQLFNTYGRYKTKGDVTWASVNNTGSFSIVSTDSTDLNGVVSNQYGTSTVSGSYNSFTVSADDASSTSGFYLVEPGSPDSVQFDVQSSSMTQLDSLTFTANVYDQFSNLVRLGENVVWSINSVTGSGDGYRLSSDTTATDTAGNAAVMLYTNPTDNTLSVGDQVTVTATSGLGSHVSSVVTIIPSDIYNLTLGEDLTAEEIGVSADTAYIDFYTALIDTFDNPLENVEVFWEVVTGSGTGESLSAGTSNTNAQGVASTRLNTNTVSGSEYQVRCWVTESSLLNSFGSFESLTHNVSNVPSMTTVANTSSNLSTIRSVSHSIKQGVSSKSSSFVRSKEIEVRRPGQFVPAQIGSSSNVERNINRVAAYDLDDTSAVVLVWPGVTHHLNNVPQNAEDIELDEQFGFTLDALDQFGNLVRDNTSVTWEVSPSSANVSIVSQDDVTTTGQAAIALEVAGNAVWDFSFKVIATVEGASDTTGSYRIDDVTAPATVSGLSISPSVWTATNDFTLAWTNPSEHSGVAGAHYEIEGESSEYVVGSGIQTLSFAMPANNSRTVKLWLQDNAGNEDESNSMVVTAKWDNTAPQTFDLTLPLAGWYKETEYRFEWETSSDVTSGLSHYLFSLNGGNETAEISPDSTGVSPVFGFAQGSHSWTVTAYDSAGNAMETSNPQTINVDHTVPGITHNPVVEAVENTAVVINAVFTEEGAGQSGIYKAELYYRRGGEANWQPPVDMSTLSSYQIASSFSTSSGIEYYLYAEDVAGNTTNKPAVGFTSISVTIPNGLASTDRWPTGVPNGADVSSYQLWSFPGNPTSTSPVNLIVDDMPDAAFDNTKWRAFAYAGSGAWTEFEQLSSLNSGESYFILIKDPGFSINTGQTYTITTNQPYQINLTSGDWTFIGNPFDFSIPLSSVLTEDSTSLSGDQNFYTYDGGSWTNASSIEPWGGYIYKSSSASTISIDPGTGSGGLLGRNAAAPEIFLEDDEWLINIAARNGLGRDKFNEVGLLQGAMDTYDNQDAFEPPLVPGGISVRINNRDWPEHGDTYTRDIRMPKEEGEYWDLEVIAQDDEHNVYLTFEDLDLIPEDLDVFAIDVTLGIAQDLRWKHVYKYAVTDPSQKHEVRFIAGTREFLQKNNAGIELFPDRYALSQNYPNPFNPQTSILLTMQDEAHVSLVVYNLLGEEVAVLVNNEYRPAGYHNFIWKGLNKDNERVASGVYFYMARVISPKGELLISDTHKMILVK